MVTFGVSTKSYQTATLNMVTLFFMIMTAFIEIIMPHLISTSYIVVCLIPVNSHGMQASMIRKRTSINRRSGNYWI